MSRRALLIALVGAAVALGAVLGGSAFVFRAPDFGRFHGARLGMTASAVRARFEEPSLGKWENVPSGSAEDTALAWRASTGPEEARFEFHSGMLVAVRAVVRADDADASHAPLEVSRGVVRTRGAGDSGTVRVTILARDCPTHHAEAERLASGAVQ
jgi:hypothetical protein